MLSMRMRLRLTSYILYELTNNAQLALGFVGKHYLSSVLQHYNPVQCAGHRFMRLRKCVVCGIAGFIQYVHTTLADLSPGEANASSFNIIIYSRPRFGNFTVEPNCMLLSSYMQTLNTF